MARTIAEKILSNHCGKDVRAGDYVICEVDFCYAQDGTSSLVIDRLEELGIRRFRGLDKFSIIIDHNSPSPNSAISKIHHRLRSFCKKKKCLLYDIGCGICHQVVAESGHIFPGSLVLGADSHTITLGALNSFACGVGSTDLALSLVTGKNWFRVPQTLKVVLEGKLPPGVFAKDVILSIIADLRADGCTYQAVEFHGCLIKRLSIDSRFTLCNMAVEMGAKTALIEADELVFEWLKKRVSRRFFRPQYADKDAAYIQRRIYNVSKLSPQVALPHRVDNVAAVTEVEGIPIQEGFLGTCTNARAEDLKVAARILKKNKLHPEVRLIIAPASKQVYLQALREGLINIFLERGCVVLNPGCGPCVGTHQGIPADSERVISTANRNFQGRMGNPKASIFLASPATVVASSIEGRIADPRRYLN